MDVTMTRLFIISIMVFLPLWAFTFAAAWVFLS